MSTGAILMAMVISILILPKMSLFCFSLLGQDKISYVAGTASSCLSLSQGLQMSEAEVDF
jgi:hypothetical protein